MRGVKHQYESVYDDNTFKYVSTYFYYRLTFLTTDNTEYVAIFKHGDDLRQDQLILQMITLMDKLLRKENLDLKLTPYRVLATSSKHGFMQFIDSITVAEVLTSESSIHNFFRKYNPCENGKFISIFKRLFLFLSTVILFYRTLWHHI